MNSRIVLAICLLGTFWSCHFNSRQSTERENGTSSAAAVSPVPDSGKKPFQASLGCPLSKYVDTLKAPLLVKQIWNRDEWDGNDLHVLDFIDSLKTRDTALRAFYFRLVTNIPGNRTLDCREAFCMNATEYVTEHPVSFITFFDDRECFSEADMEVWADMVAAEYGIDAEDDIKAALTKFFKGLRRECTSCLPQQKTKLEHFIRLVEKRI